MGISNSSYLSTFRKYYNFVTIDEITLLFYKSIISKGEE